MWRINMSGSLQKKRVFFHSSCLSEIITSRYLLEKNTVKRSTTHQREAPPRFQHIELFKRACRPVYIYIRKTRSFFLFSSRNCLPYGVGFFFSSPFHSSHHIFWLTIERVATLFPAVRVVSGMKRTRTFLICVAFTSSALLWPIPTATMV